MSTRTTNLNLVKPSYTDAADIGDINDNMDILDDAYVSVNNEIATKEPILAKGSLIGTSQTPVDLDEYFDSGYYFVTINSYIYNAPVLATAYGYLEVMKMTNNVTLQRFTMYGDDDSTIAGNTYARFYTNNQWYSWILVSNTNAGAENLIWGMDDLRAYAINSSVMTKLPYPMSMTSSTFTDNASCIGINNEGLLWRSAITETDKYCTYFLGLVPNIFPITVSMLSKQGSYYGQVLSATITSTSGTYPLYGSGSTVHAGYLKIENYQRSPQIKKLVWVVGKSANMSADYDARFLYNTSGCNIVSIRCELGSRTYDTNEMKMLIDTKERDLLNYLENEITKAGDYLTKGTTSGIDGYIESGLYFYEASANAPVPVGTKCYLEVWKMDGDTIPTTKCIQRLIPQGTTGQPNTCATYIRYYDNSIWSPWVKTNDHLATNLLLGGDDLSGRYDTLDENVYTNPPYPIVTTGTTYSNQARSIAIDRYGLVWNRNNPTVVEERNKYTTFKLCNVDGIYPISVNILVKVNGLYTVCFTALITESSSTSKFILTSGADLQLGYVQAYDGAVMWVIGRSGAEGDEPYDANGLYTLNETARIAAIRCEYGDRVYTKDEMVRMLNKKDTAMFRYVDDKTDTVYQTLGTNQTYSALQTTNKTLVGAINEILARL